ncbi:MAG: hypothetical protein GSR78_00365 [Desulfurococcales archaeon]|nr:hypothetical protein [Desulfurococcales archaeon]
MARDCYKARLELEIPDPGVIPRLVEDLGKAISRSCGRPAEGPSWRVYTCGGTMVSIATTIPEPGLLMLPSSKVTILVESSEPEPVRSILDAISRVIREEYQRIVSIQLRL